MIWQLHLLGWSSLVLLFYFILFYFILFYFILFYFILFYFILFYFILFYFILFYFILFYFILFYFILFYFILFYFILFYFILFYFILFYFIFLFFSFSFLLSIPFSYYHLWSNVDNGPSPDRIAFELFETLHFLSLAGWFSTYGVQSLMDRLDNKRYQSEWSSGLRRRRF